MSYLLMTVLESDDNFRLVMSKATGADRVELKRMKEGMNKRKKFMIEHASCKRFWFEKTSDKLNAIKEWYPRAYRILEEHIPNLVEMPNDMGYAVLKLADDLVQHHFLPADQRLLRLCV